MPGEDDSKSSMEGGPETETECRNSTTGDHSGHNALEGKDGSLDTDVVIGDGGSYKRMTGRPALSCIGEESSSLGSSLELGADAVIDGGTCGGLIVRAASIRGRSHRFESTLRQDSFHLGFDQESRYLLIAVADGVGSLPLSHLAACAAVRSGVERLKEAIEMGELMSIDWNSIFNGVNEDVTKRSLDEAHSDHRPESKQMATTLALAAVDSKCNDSGGRRYAVASIGDTSAWLLKHDGKWESLSRIKGEGDAIFESSVAALPSECAFGGIVPMEGCMEINDVLFIMTDGVGDALGDGEGIVGTSLAKHWASPPSSYSFAHQVDFARRSHTDDRTVVGVWVDGVD